MDLIELQRTERRKSWVFVIFIVALVYITVTEVGDYNSPVEKTEIEGCLEVLQEHDLDSEDEQVEYCRKLILNIMKPAASKTVI
jgi:hypothetical protein